MNILIIGNGFDLAHDLPTKYTDFLEFCKRVFPIYENVEGRGVHLYQQEYLFDWNFNKEIKEKLKSAYEGRRKIITDGNIAQIETTYPRLDEMYALIKDNNWVEYFLQCDMHGKENWIDFESEISDVIQSISKGIDENNPRNMHNNVLCLENKFFNDKFTNNVPEYLQINIVEEQEKIRKPEISYKELRNILLADLNKLIRAFEIYLTEYVEKIDIKVISPDIKEIAAISYNDRGQKDTLFSKIISFNYTDIYEHIYLSKYNIDLHNNIDYIHGKADINNTIDTNNMVLGIDEYLSKKRRDKETEFIAFKKIYQRIHKRTGCKYKEWIDALKRDFADYLTELEKSKTEKNIMNLKATVSKLKKQYLNKHHVYIFGHSLDVTDKDILRDLILNDNVHTTIFYHDKDTMGQQIANLVKVIGQKELIRRAGGKDKLIEFKPQKPMTPIDN